MSAARARRRDDGDSDSDDGLDRNRNRERDQGNGEVLPGPVTLSAGHGRRPLVRIAGPSLRVHWAKLKQKFGTASAPSESVLDGSTTEASADAMVVQSGPVTAHADKEAAAVGEMVDVVVVERDFHLNGTETAPSTIDKSDKSSQLHPHLARPPVPSHVGPGPGTTERSSLMSHATSLLSKLVPRSAVDGVRHFFDMGSELQHQVERQYRKEQWHLTKRIALMSSLFYIVNWALAVAFVPRPMTMPDYIFYYAVTPVLTLPLPFLVAWNRPRDNGWFYQTFIGVTTWMWAAYVTVYINVCGYYGSHSYVSCNGKDFIGIF